jgi:O-antigen/teichoic acid export membrane protein
MMGFVPRTLLARLAVGSLSRNGVFSLCQSLTVMTCMFLSYRLVIAHAGLERFGVWSLLLTASALARIGDVSGGGALARFVALASRDNVSGRARDLTHTVLLTSLAINAGIGLSVWVVAPFVLPLFVAPTYMAEAQALIPYVAASIVLGALAVAVTSGIDGAQRADQRALVVSVASLAFLGACVVLVPRYGVLGFGASQLLQQATMLTLAWLALRRHVCGLGWFPYRWKRHAFVETTGYAMKLNAITTTGLLFEPLTKFAFNHAGGPGLVALYELASRIVVQVRGLAVSAATPLVPSFAARSGPEDPAFRATLERSTRVAVFAAVGATVATLAMAPVVSLVVLGRLSTELLVMNAALTVGWSINILAVPTYLAGQALGVLRWNFLSHTAAAASVVVGALVFLPSYGPPGLVAAIAVGLVLSTAVVLFGNAHLFNAADIFWRLRRSFLVGGIVIVSLCLAAGIAIFMMGI